MIEKEKFRSYTLDEDKDTDVIVISLKLNKEEQEILKSSQQIIEQKKDGTAIKQLFKLGAKVVHEEKTKYILDTIFGNKRKNKRSNIFDFD